VLVLGIESSCDETGVALYDSEQKLVAHQIYSQIELHALYGGVVPELASRDHIRKLPLLVDAALEEAGKEYSDIDGIAFTEGPGLIGALMVGALYAEGLSYALKKPLLGVNHMEAHLQAVHLEDEVPEYPFMTLLVSGGHSQLVLVKEFGEYEILGDTLDDAVGEAFDKTAKLMDLPYPGGAKLAKMAEAGDEKAYDFPRPMIHSGDLKFSFSGLKTKVAMTIKDSTEADYPNIAASFQRAVIDTLVAKAKRAVNEYQVKSIVIAGGVAANKLLRQELARIMEPMGIRVFYPRPLFCTDNGAMVAYVGHERLIRNQGSLNYDVKLKARWPLSALSTKQESEQE
jgi:N6-L-threonylcarbamoyladenine synthase